MVLEQRLDGVGYLNILENHGLRPGYGDPAMTLTNFRAESERDNSPAQFHAQCGSALSRLFAKLPAR